jgi:hypothetical protein
MGGTWFVAGVRLDERALDICLRRGFVTLADDLLTLTGTGRIWASGE